MERIYFQLENRLDKGQILVKILRNILFLFLILLLAGLVIAQDSDTAESTDEPDSEVTEEPQFDFTATQESIDSTATQQAIFNTATQSAVNATGTQTSLNSAATRTQVANATSTAMALIPTATPQYPTFSINLTVDPPPSVDDTYDAGTELAFTLLVENEGGGSPLNIPNIVIAIPYNTEIFAEPNSGAISGGGIFANGTVKWSLTLVEGTSQNLTISVPIRNTVARDTDIELRAEVRTANERVTLARSDIASFKILTTQDVPTTTSTSDKAQQGSGLFQSEASFAALIGGFFWYRYPAYLLDWSVLCLQSR